MKKLLLIIFCLTAGIQAGEVPQISIESRDFVRTWLLTGPLPNPLSNNAADYKHDHTCVGFFTDYLESIGGETDVQPSAGLQFKAAGRNYTWQLHHSPTDYIDLFKFYPENQKVVAYAACQLVATTDQTILLGIGSNDGIKVWLNGEPVWENHLPRGAEADADWVRVDVKKGKNQLLLKIDQGFGNWGFYLRVLDLQEKLAVLQTEQIQEIPLEIVPGSAEIVAAFGKNSRYRILEKPPVYEIWLLQSDGPSLQKKSAPLGEPVSFSAEFLRSGPYRIQADVTLPNQQEIETGEYFYLGESPHELKMYDASGKPISSAFTDEVVLLNPKYETVEKATRLEASGNYSLLREDISPFLFRVNLPTLALGSRMYLLDNLGAGYKLQKHDSFQLDLPREALRCLRQQIQQRLAHSNPAVWLKKNIENRLKKTRSEATTPEQIYRNLELLSSLKTRLKINSDFPVWFAPGIEKVGRNEPVPEIEQEKIYLSVAKNEYEPFQLVLRPNQPLEQLSIQFDIARNQNGDQLAAENFEVLLVDYVKVEKFTDFFGSKGDWPDPLPSLTDSSQIPGSKNTPLWITVFAPKTQPPGTYKTGMQLFSGQKKITEIPLEIEIRDFTLPDETHTEVAYGVYVNRAYHGPIDDAQFREIHDLYMQICASHRISPYKPHAGADIKIDIDEATNEVSLGFTEFDLAMERYLDQFKFNSFNMGGLPGNLAGHERYSERYNELFGIIYAEIQEHLREKGWLQKAYWYWVDEPPKADYPKVRCGMELLKTACPDIRRLLTCNQEDAPVPYFFDTVNLWVPIMDRYSLEQAHARQKLGETVWWYVCTGPKAPYPNNFITHPAINHRVRFWMVDAVGLDGSLYWSLTWWGQNPWKQAMAVSPSNTLWGNGDGRLFYPPRRVKPEIPVVAPPVRSIRLENLRDGLEDRECFWLLRQHPAAKKLITEIQQQTVPTLTAYEQNPALFLLARERIYRALAGKKF